MWLNGVFKASVTVQEDGVRSISLDATGVNQEHGDLCSIFTGVEHLTHTHTHTVTDMRSHRRTLRRSFSYGCSHTFYNKHM